MADEAGAIDAEQRRAAMLGVVDLAFDVAKGALGQHQAGAIERRLPGLLLEHPDHHLTESLGHLENDVAGESVTDHDIDVAGEDIPAFDVADEVDPGVS